MFACVCVRFVDYSVAAEALSGFQLSRCCQRDDALLNPYRDLYLIGF